jgi:putative ubiquitin-RnfH superfamily antitoxin RatB of RatAB toxin-antitoxin module
VAHNRIFAFQLFIPGKNLNAWAGYDVAIRAQNCADISAAQGDLRAKADGNVMILGGNNGCGGVVIESRATCPAYDFVGVGTAAVASGIMLLARQSPIVAMGNHMYLSTNRQRYAGEMHGDATAPDNDTGEFAGGSIVIDAGQHNVVTYAKTAHRHLGGSAIDIFVRTGTYVATEYNYDRAYIGMPLDVRGRLAVSDCVMAGGNVQTLGTYESSTGAAVSAIVEDSGITTTMTQISARATTLGTYGDTANQEGRELVQGDADICLAEFSFRTVSQYGTSGLKLYELQWHQLARLSSQALPTWNEPSVTQLQKTGTDDETYPYPGRENWTGDGSTEAYVLQDLTLYTASTNTRDARGTPSVPNSYETATLPALQHVIMQDYYPVIVGF